ncbi:MAG: radical SAM protein [Candidatus Krumholzibacteriia bacterium]
MRVLLVSANTEKITMPTVPLGLGLVAEAVRRARHEVEFVDLMFEADPEATIRSRIAAFEPEAIGLSIRNIDDQSLREPQFLLAATRPVVAACREACAAPLILGGAGYSIFPDAALAYLGADLGVCGDGEAALPALLARLERGEDPFGLPGVHVAGRGAAARWRPCPHLAGLGEPAPETWQAARIGGPEVFIPIQTRRGCPNDCSYCSTASIQGRPIRTGPVRAVVDLVERLAVQGFRRFWFVDNSFNLPEAYALAMCHELTARRLDIAWRCILYPRGITSRLASALAEAGCREVSLGFESGDAGILRRLNKRFDPAEVRAAASLLAEHGVERHGFLLLGGPGETRDTVCRSLDFVASLHLEAMRITTGIRIYPGTALARYARQAGMIDADDDLLLPRFYLEPGLDPWIFDAVPS